MLNKYDLHWFEKFETCMPNLVHINQVEDDITSKKTRSEVTACMVFIAHYGLLTKAQQEYLSSPANTPCAKRQNLCTIMLFFDESCVEKFLQCLSESSHYEPHRELLQKIR